VLGTSLIADICGGVQSCTEVSPGWASLREFLTLVCLKEKLPAPMGEHRPDSVSCEFETLMAWYSDEIVENFMFCLIVR